MDNSATIGMGKFGTVELLGVMLSLVAIIFFAFVFPMMNNQNVTNSNTYNSFCQSLASQIASDKKTVSSNITTIEIQEYSKRCS